MNVFRVREQIAPVPLLLLTADFQETLTTTAVSSQPARNGMIEIARWVDNAGGS